MSTPTPRHTSRRHALQALLERKDVGGPTALARALGKPNLAKHFPSILRGTRDLGDELANRIEVVLQLPTGWMDRQHPSTGEAAPHYSEAQQMSHPSLSYGLPLLDWEDIMSTTPRPEVFRALLPDDALAPDYPAGTEVVWTTKRRADPGRLVLVQDRHGQLHARQVHQGRAPGVWIAAPINPAFVAFDSVSDELTLVAVFKGRLEPDDT